MPRPNSSSGQTELLRRRIYSEFHKGTSPADALDIVARMFEAQISADSAMDEASPVDEVLSISIRKKCR